MASPLAVPDPDADISIEGQQLITDLAQCGLTSPCGFGDDPNPPARCLIDACRDELLACSAPGVGPLASPCDAPRNVGFGSVVGSTIDAENANEDECTGRGGEVAHRFVVQEDTDVCLDTIGSDFDTILFLRRSLYR
jgi:hypothetical protein